MHSATQTFRSVNLNRDSIIQPVTRFCRDVRADDMLGPTFEGVLAGRWDAHLPRMFEFWSTVMLGTRRFKGNVSAKHMAVPGVTPAPLSMSRSQAVSRTWPWASPASCSAATLAKL